MSHHQATVVWQRGEGDFQAGKYSRGHFWHFDGGTQVPASSSPHSVPLPYSLEAAVDPEEAFVAALSSCHMLWFLWHAAKRGYVVDEYVDQATGTMKKAANGKVAITDVLLRPRVTFAGAAPSPEVFQELHHAAHDACFIANSVKSDMRCEAEIV